MCVDIIDTHCELYFRNTSSLVAAAGSTEMTTVLARLTVLSPAKVTPQSARLRLSPWARRDKDSYDLVPSTWHPPV